MLKKELYHRPSSQILIPDNTLRKSNVTLWLYFGNLCKLLSANIDVLES